MVERWDMAARRDIVFYPVTICRLCKQLRILLLARAAFGLVEGLFGFDRYVALWGRGGEVEDNSCREHVSILDLRG